MGLMENSPRMDSSAHSRSAASAQASSGKAGRASAQAKADRSLGPIVSSAHLASGRMPALSEFEFGLGMLGHAYGRWMVRCMAAAGVPDLAPLDVLVVHHVAHRERPKTLADLCLVLDVEDTHLVSYAVKKLEGLGLVSGGRRGKEKTITLTPRGKAACMRYREIREALLVRAVKNAGLDEERLSEIAALMRALSGHYDQGARAAASL
jgi:predicted MarR family transcription regulator